MILPIAGKVHTLPLTSVTDRQTRTPQTNHSSLIWFNSPINWHQGDKSNSTSFSSLLHLSVSFDVRMSDELLFLVCSVLCFITMVNRSELCLTSVCLRMRGYMLWWEPHLGADIVTVATVVTGELRSTADTHPSPDHWPPAAPHSRMRTPHFHFLSSNHWVPLSLLSHLSGLMLILHAICNPIINSNNFVPFPLFNIYLATKQSGQANVIKSLFIKHEN